MPTTRVEKVDHEPSHGEVPGTDACNMRKSDAEPDEVSFVEESTNSGAESPAMQPSTPGGQPIPITRVQLVEPSSPSHGDVPNTRAFEMRKEDAEPDIVEVAEDTAGTATPSPRASARLTKSGSPTSDGVRSPVIDHSSRKSSEAERKMANGTHNEGEDESADGGFGDDFDDFEEGEEDAEFGDFDNGFQEAEPTPPPQPTPPTFSIVSNNIHRPMHIVTFD